MAAHPAWDEDGARLIIASLSHLEGATLPILHALQEEFGYVDPKVVPLIADALNLSRADVYGTISFYHDFRTVPPPRRIVKLCRAEACQALGCETLVQDLAREHGIVVDGGSHDAVVETVYCLGNCALGPSALVEGELLGRVDADRIAALCGARQ
jgi:formate dehydrogenase subunit gamma